MGDGPLMWPDIQTVSLTFYRLCALATQFIKHCRNLQKDKQGDPLFSINTHPPLFSTTLSSLLSKVKSAEYGEWYPL